MQVQLGQDVYGSDNKKVGSVDRLVIDPRTKEVKQLVVGKGFFTHEDKLVDLAMVDYVGNEGVVLNVPSSTVHDLPGYVKEEVVVRTRPEDLADRPLGYAAGTGGEEILLGTPNVGRGYEGASGSFYDPAPINPPIVETEQNIPGGDVTIGKGAELVSSDGQNLGKVQEVFLDDRGNTTGFLIESGHIRQHHFSIPIDWVGEIDDNKVHLNVTAEKVHSRGSPEGNPI